MASDDNSRFAFGPVLRQSAALKGRVLQRLRIIGALEGVSFVVLLYASIVLKRMHGDEDAIYVPGMIHGILFIIYCAALRHAMRVNERPVKWAAKYFVAALIPLGPFVVDGSLKRELAELPEDD